MSIDNIAVQPEEQEEYHSRYEAEPRIIPKYPAKKKGQTTKDRRFNHKTEKLSDKNKAHGKRDKDGKSYRQSKLEGISSD